MIKSRKAVELARSHQGRLYATVGCHPTRCGEFDSEGPELYLDSLRQGVSVRTVEL